MTTTQRDGQVMGHARALPEHAPSALASALAGAGLARRRLVSALAGAAFTGAALVIAMPAAPAAEQLDAELIAACATMLRLEAEYRAAINADPHDAIEDHAPPGYMEAWNRLAEMPAASFAGAAAKAHAIATFYDGGGGGDAVVDSLIADVIRLGGAA